MTPKEKLLVTFGCNGSACQPALGHGTPHLRHLRIAKFVVGNCSEKSPLISPFRNHPVGLASFEATLPVRLPETVACFAHVSLRKTILSGRTLLQTLATQLQRNFVLQGSTPKIGGENQPLVFLQANPEVVPPTKKQQRKKSVPNRGLPTRHVYPQEAIHFEEGGLHSLKYMAFP